MKTENKDHYNLQNANEILRGHRNAIELMAKRESLFNILHSLVTSLENQYEGSYCSILLIDEEAQTFKCGVKAKDTHNFSLELTGVSIKPPYMGPCCMSTTEARPVVVVDLEIDPRWGKPWREWSLSNNLRSCRSQPIIASNGKVLGAFAMYHKELDDPTSERLYFLELVALIASIAIERKNLEVEENEKRQELEKLNQELSNALILRDEFLSIASHELKNPLTAIKLQNQINLRKINDNINVSSTAVRKMLLDNDKQINRILHHVESLLDMSLLNKNKIKKEIEKFNLSEFVEELVAVLKPQIDNANCTIEVITPQIINVGWDSYRIEQVINNLIINSTKYAAGSSIKIEIIDNDEIVKINIIDNGPGIDEKYQANIFDRYNRGAKENDLTTGLGLGLHIVREIIKFHNGKINLISKKNEGTIFAIEMPKVLEQGPTIS